MGHLNCSKYDGKNKHLTYKDRLRIEVMIRQGVSTKEIGINIGKHQRTVQRELKRGKIQQLNGTTWEYYHIYDADTAQRKYLLEMEAKGPSLKIGKDHRLCNHIESELKAGKSPDVIAYEIGNSKDFTVNICTKTIYNYLDKNIFLDADYGDLPYGHYKKDKSRCMNRPSYKNSNGRSIEERPEEVNERKELGHWEMDLVVGGKGKGNEALLTITERVAKREIIKKIPDKTQQSVINVLDKMERRMGRVRFKEMFKSFTVDNGSEFLNSSEIERSCLSNNKQRTMVYYAHPYSAYERGTNENMNRMIRRFIPKGADISQYTHREIKRIENWLNNYPRKILGYKTPLEIYGEVA